MELLRKRPPEGSGEASEDRKKRITFYEAADYDAKIFHEIGRKLEKEAMKVDIYKTNKKYKVIYADPPLEYKNKGSRMLGLLGK